MILDAVSVGQMLPKLGDDGMSMFLVDFLRFVLPPEYWQLTVLRVPPSNNPFHKGIPGIQTTGTQTINLPLADIGKPFWLEDFLGNLVP